MANTQLQQIKRDNLMLADATRLLAKVSTPKEAKKLMDMASAAEHYAKKAQLGEEAELYAKQIRIDAQTLLGGFLKAMAKNVGAKGRKGGGTRGSIKEPQPESPPTLADVGISKRLSSEAQALHTAKEEAPELHERVRKGEVPPSDVRQHLGRRQMTEEEKETKYLVESKKNTTRWYEKTCAVLNSGACPKMTAGELNPAFGLYSNDPDRKLTPQRLRSASKQLTAVATEWEKLS